MAQHSPSPTIILDDDDGDRVVIYIDEDNDEEVFHEVEQIIDLTDEDDGKHHTPNPALLMNPHHGEGHVQHNGFNISIGNHVEVIAIQDSSGAQFLQVTDIGGGFIRGLPLTRVRHLDGQLPRKMNEICLIIDTAHGDPRMEKEQAAIIVPLQHVISSRDVVYTNADYPAHKYRLIGGEDVHHAQEHGRLVCRWKYKRVWASPQKRRSGELTLIFLTDIKAYQLYTQAPLLRDLRSCILALKILQNPSTVCLTRSASMIGEAAISKRLLMSGTSNLTAKDRSILLTTTFVVLEEPRKCAFLQRIRQRMVLMYTGVGVELETPG